MSTIVLYCSCCSCRNTYVAPYPGERLAKLQFYKSDTVYVYNWKISHKSKKRNISYVWYHKNNHIHLYLLQDKRTVRHKKIPATNYAVNDTISQYYSSYWFESGHRYGECFDAYDEFMLYVYIKDVDNIHISADHSCLQNKKCKEGTFAYKLQYDLQKVLGSLKPYKFTVQVNRVKP